MAVCSTCSRLSARRLCKTKSRVVSLSFAELLKELFGLAALGKDRLSSINGVLWQGLAVANRVYS